MFRRNAIKRSNLLFTVEDDEDETRFHGPNNVLLADEVYKIRHGRISGFTKIWLDTLEAINHRMPTDRGAIAFYICANAAKYAAYAYILADIVILRGRSNKQYLADLVRIDYANAIIRGRDARRSAYKLNDIIDKANKPGDYIRGAEEVEGAVEVKKSEAAIF
ncbi:hypothetical protein Tdes44962_MAKER10446 [Teratosphaeria destructans]|uniref:Uncharacterized protein n=1 Tax=Teratosphaeria destructans TaxID=418781 RepID=A0A9W7SHU5_9PEZI|nr:hypothetical protein Tdes44962_MAKER10446 [Teratosphaeria destructans]